MGLPRGRRWVDLPRKPAPTASERWRACAILALQADPPSNDPDPIATRDRLHREVEAEKRRQGELRFRAA